MFGFSILHHSFSTLWTSPLHQRIMIRPITTSESQALLGVAMNITITEYNVIFHQNVLLSLAPFSVAFLLLQIAFLGFIMSKIFWPKREQTSIVLRIHVFFQNPVTEIISEFIIAIVAVINTTKTLRAIQSCLTISHGPKQSISTQLKDG